MTGLRFLRTRLGWLSWLLVFASCVQAQPAEDHATAPASDDPLSILSRRLSERLAPKLKVACLANARTSLTVRDLSSGAVLFMKSGDELLSPASNQKLLTTAALLRFLSAEHVIRTKVLASRLPDADGDVGVIYLRGAGDPSLGVEGLYLAARAVAAAGVRRVHRVVADASYFDGPGRIPSWPERNHPFWYGAPSSALSANFNVVVVHARGVPGDSRPRVWADPFPEFFELINKMQSGRGTMRVGTTVLPGDTTRQQLTVTGRVRPGRSSRVLRAVENPALYCATGFTESLRRVGVAVAAPPVSGLVPAEAVLLHSHPSRPLGLLLHDMNKQSSNVFAETLLKRLGAEVLGVPGTTAKGLAVLSDHLARVDADAAGRCTLVDGSGLSAENRLSTRVLTELVLDMKSSLSWPEFLVTLPVAGQDGTLKRRLNGRLTGVDGSRIVRAKTGRLSSVVALTGIAPVESSRRVVFSLLVNDYHCPSWQVQDAVDQVVLALIHGAEKAADPDDLGKSLARRLQGEGSGSRDQASDG